MAWSVLNSIAVSTSSLSLGVESVFLQEVNPITNESNGNCNYKIACFHNLIFCLGFVSFL